MTSLKDYIETHNINNVTSMLTESFEVMTQRKLEVDEIEYLAKTTKFAFDNYTVLYSKVSINFAGPDEKEKVDKLVKKFMQRLTKLMTHYIFSRVECYILTKEVTRLKNQLKPEE